MKQLKPLHFFFLALLTLGTVNLQAQTYEATLTGNQQVGPVKTVASGEVTLNLSGNDLTVNGSFKNLSSAVDVTIAGGAHLHDSLAGANSGVLIPIPPTNLNEDSTGGTFSINRTLDPASASELNAKLQNRQIYINIHTQQYPSGELRGQVVPSADQLFYADLKGDKQNPAVNTNASGGVIAELNGNQLTVSGAFSDLDSDFNFNVAGGAHLHFGDRDRNGGVTIPLNATLGNNLRNGRFIADSNTYSLNSDQLDSLNINHLYVNIHTQNNPGGAIRGQLNSQDFQTYESSLSGVTQIPSVVSTGTGDVTYKVIGERLLLRGDFGDLTSPVDESIAGGAHIHAGRAGENGGIQIPLNVDLESSGQAGVLREDSNEYVINSAIEGLMDNAALYLNIHTNRYPSGEIRGQVTPENDELYVAELSGVNQAPPVLSSGKGSVIIERRNDSIYVSGSFRDLSSPFNPDVAGGAHLHVGIYGRNGGVQKSLTTELDNDSLGGTFLRSENQFALSSTDEDNLEQARFYVNVHTDANPSGEIRGQVIEKPAAIFQAFLSGSQQVQPVETDSRGAGLVALYEDNEIAVTGAFDGLDSALATSVAGGAHLHKGLAGQNGGVEVPLDAETDNTDRNGEFPIDSNRTTISDGLVNDLLNRNLYINVHSQEYTSGEIRGQVVPQSTKVFYSNLGGGYQVLPVQSRGFGAVVAEVRNGDVTLSGSFQGLSSDLNTNVAGGAHIHEGYAGQNGSVIFGLTPETGNNDTSGVFRADSNTFSFNDAQLDSLQNRQYYVNVHSQNFPSGEIRGQLTGPVENTYYTSLVGTNQVPAVNTDAQGGLIAEKLGGELKVTGSFSGLESDFNANVAGGAHLHEGYAGQNGGVQIGLDATVNDDTSGFFALDSNTYQPSDANVALLTQRQLYANIHTQDNPGGAIRGQLAPYANAYFTTSLAPVNQVPPRQTDAIGGAFAEYRNGILRLSGAFEGLNSGFNENVAGGAHLHNGTAGENGGVDISLSADVEANDTAGVLATSANTFDLGENQDSRLFDEGYYVNVHSDSLSSGELRGQLLNAGNRFPRSTMIQAPADGASVTVSSSSTESLTIEWNASADPDGNKTTYIWQLAATDSFETALVNVNVGTDTTLNLSYSTIDSVLQANGIGTDNDTLTAFHRVVTSDGSVVTPSGAREASFSRAATGIEDEQPANNVSLNAFPNPATDQARIRYEVARSSDVALQVYNTNGQTVHRADLGQQAADREQQYTLNVSDWKPGLYLYSIEVQTANGTTLKYGKLNVVR